MNNAVNTVLKQLILNNDFTLEAAAEVIKRDSLYLDERFNNDESFTIDELSSLCRWLGTTLHRLIFTAEHYLLDNTTNGIKNYVIN